MATLHLKPAAGAVKPNKRVGRGEGSGHGKTSTRGSNGAGSRSGNKRKIGFEGGQMPLARRLPKFGFNSPFRIEYEEVNISRLDAAVKAGKISSSQTITPEVLLASGLTSRKTRPVKILGNGELSTAMKIKVHKVSKGALEKIQKAGGSVEPYV
jgi:large subunit ribosomal protein L15